jgi:hypothetical protein
LPPRSRHKNLKEPPLVQGLPLSESSCLSTHFGSNAVFAALLVLWGWFFYRALFKTGTTLSMPDLTTLGSEGTSHDVELGVSAPDAVRSGDTFTVRFVAYTSNNERKVRSMLWRLTGDHLSIEPLAVEFAS